MRLENRHILIISNEPWGPVWYSKHHYAHALSENNKVYFVDPPQAYKPGLPSGTSLTVESVNPNLKVLRYHNAFPLTGRLDAVFKRNEKAIGKAICHYLKSQDAEKPIFWSFDPYRLLDPSLVGADLSLYQSMDYYENRRENWLVEKVDSIIGVSQAILDKYSEFKGEKLLLPHGITPPVATNEEVLSAEEKPEILLMGSINYRIDFGLLIKVAQKFPDHQLKIIGPLWEQGLSDQDKEQLQELQQLTNVVFTGAIPYAELEQHVLRAALTLFVMKQDKQGNRLSSLKVLQYLRLGKKLVATPLSDYESLSDLGLMKMTADPDEFLYFSSQFLKGSEGPEIRRKRMDYARQFDYGILLKQVEEFLSRSREQL